MRRITSFKGEHFFLSNFYPSKFVFHGFEWKTAEHAYQAMKCIDENFWKEMAYGDLTAGQAKKIGQKVELPAHWNKSKVYIMRNIVTQKFHQNTDLMKKLDHTKGFELIEGNTWGDTFWGQSPIGVGKNHLGKILMSLRDDITRAFG
jgi:ribA/ribD-fused uncharacterized protein